MPRVRAVEGFVAEREVGNDIVFDRSLEHRPLKPGGIAQVAALDACPGVQPHPCENIAAKSLDQGQALAGPARPGHRDTDRTLRMDAGEDLFDERQALLHLADANPDSRIDVA